MTATPWGGRLVFVGSTTSTMDDAQSLEDRGFSSGSLVWAGFQTEGRGRHPGRSWVAEPGASLLFTVFWDRAEFAVPSFAPSLTVGLGICFWLESLGLPSDFPVSLKWPNDVYLGGRKVAGTLVRQRVGSGKIHAGLGINLRRPPGEQFRTPPGSLADAGLTLEPGVALESLLPALALSLVHQDPRTECERRLWKRGQPLEISRPGADEPATGTVVGLDPGGGLIWDGPRGREVLTSGE